MGSSLSSVGPSGHREGHREGTACGQLERLTPHTQGDPLHRGRLSRHRGLGTPL